MGGQSTMVLSHDIRIICRWRQPPLPINESRLIKQYVGEAVDEMSALLRERSMFTTIRLNPTT